MLGQQTLAQLSEQTGSTIRTLQRNFDKLAMSADCPVAPKEPVNLIVDATFFSRSDGVLIFRANSKDLYWRFIVQETVAEVAAGLDILDDMGYHFKSVTIDGKRGIIRLFEARYPGISIQLCQFHQSQIIRRYTTNNPKTECGKKLKYDAMFN